MSQPDSSTQLTCQATRKPLNVSDFFPGRKTPGNVGLCLSGGGSRALVAGMGQLRALGYLEANGSSLLSQIKAISTVSGGSWVGVPFEYLTDPTSDSDYLNEYVPDQGKLVLTQTSGHSQAETLDQLPKGNIGQTPCSILFSPEALALQLLYFKWAGVPTNMLWQTLVGSHVLKPYGLYQPEKHLPNSLFTHDTRSLKEQVTGPNPSLENEPSFFFADTDSSQTRIDRPYLICNMSMFASWVRQPNRDFYYLVPSQSTPFYTGIFGDPDALDQNQQQPGGGAVTSFAANSILDEATTTTFKISQERQWSLTDAVGVSSSFFAQVLENKLEAYRNDMGKMLSDLKNIEGNLRPWLEEHLPGGLSKNHHHLMDLAEKLGLDKLEKTLEREIEEELAKLEIPKILGDIQGLIPSYNYWSVSASKPVSDPKPSRFADGGDLENTGIVGMLAYEDIDALIVCVNTSEPLGKAEYGIFDPETGEEILGTKVKVPDQVAPLFGYQAYRKGDDVKKGGYYVYANDPDPAAPIFRFSQVFPSQFFAPFVKMIWEATGNLENPGSNQSAAVVSQKLQVMENKWMGVTGGRTVEVVWVINNIVQDWKNLLSKDVQNKVTALQKSAHFPNYSTFKTHLTAEEVNIFANLTAWVIANDKQASTFTNLFKPSGNS